MYFFVQVWLVAWMKECGTSQRHWKDSTCGKTQYLSSPRVQCIVLSDLTLCSSVWLVLIIYEEHIYVCL